MEGFVNELSRTLALANRFLLDQLEGSSLEGLAPSHGDILAELFTTGSTTMSELSRRISRDPSTVTALVKKLVALGIATTEKSPVDRRATMVSLTERGRALYDEFSGISKRLQATWSEGVSPADLATTRHVLETVRLNLARSLGGECEDETRRVRPRASCSVREGREGDWNSPVENQATLATGAAARCEERTRK